MENLINLSAENNIETMELIKDYLALGKELVERKKFFKFSGISQEDCSKMKVELEEHLKHDNFLFAAEITPIDKLVERFEKEGIQVVPGIRPESGFFIVSAKAEIGGVSDDICKSSIRPKDLQVIDEMDEGLKNLIMMGKRLNSLCKKNI